MIGNYFKTTLRSLLKNRAYSFLNIAGLAIGIACASMIFLWVQDEATFDHSYKKHDMLYRVMENQVYNGQITTMQATPGLLGPALKAEIPGIKNTARFTNNENLQQLFALGDKTINEQGNYADASIFSMLDLPFVYGSSANAFNDLHSLVISESMSKKFFGNSNPVGKNLKVDNEQEFTITGVFKDLADNSTLHFSWLAPIKLFELKTGWFNMWGANGLATYVELDPKADINAVNKQLYNFLGTKMKDNTSRAFLYAMNDWHLYDHFTNGLKDNEGRIKYVRLFSIIAWIILIIACINFMNLSTARSEHRSREVGVRKVLGAGKNGLVGRFIGESLILSFAALIIAVFIIYLILPAFNLLVGKQLSIDIFNPLHLFGLIVIGLITGLLAGSYPAFYLSSFNPVGVLKGIKEKSGGAAVFIRKGLVITQFTVSLVLIISTIITYQQVQHTMNRNMGYNKQNLLSLNAQGLISNHFKAIKNDLLNTGFVENATLSTSNILQLGFNKTSDIQWENKDPDKNILISVEGVTPEYIPTAGMKIKEGRNFYDEFKADSNHVIINQSFANLIGKGSQVGHIITNDGHKLQIVGVINDFVYDYMYNLAPAPLMLFPGADQTNYSSYLSIRIKQGVDVKQALAKIGTVMKQDNPGYPFDYQFLDQEFDKLFKSDMLTGKLAGVFASLGVLISCLGLFGLAAYTAERRIKEIGIRKVLGASVSGLAGMLSIDFLKLVAIACAIAFPLAWWALNNWLQNFEYRVTVHWWVFAGAGVLAMLIALATVSFQAIKAALSNPVKSLRSE